VYSACRDTVLRCFHRLAERFSTELTSFVVIGGGPEAEAAAQELGWRFVRVAPPAAAPPAQCSADGPACGSPSPGQKGRPVAAAAPGGGEAEEPPAKRAAAEGASKAAAPPPDCTAAAAGAPRQPQPDGGPEAPGAAAATAPGPEAAAAAAAPQPQPPDDPPLDGWLSARPPRPPPRDSTGARARHAGQLTAEVLMGLALA
ncbi:hypothetical protein Rsub_11485, partial [Raphidocelis subcapitata]